MSIKSAISLSKMPLYLNKKQTKGVVGINLNIMLLVLCFLSLINSLHILTSGGGKNMKRVGTRDIFSLFTVFLIAHLNCLGEGGKIIFFPP